MKRRVFYLGSIIIGLLLFTKPALAQNTCTDIYGGGETCVQHQDLQVNKQVQEPDGTAYRENLSGTSNYFQPGATVQFRVTVKNVSNGVMENVTMTDVLPGHIEFVRGKGTYDRATRSLTHTIARLAIGQVETIDFSAKVAAANALPASPSPLCINNLATATASNNRTSTDGTTFCITGNTNTLGAQTQLAQLVPTQTQGQTPTTTKGGLPVFTPTTPARTPNTGPETLALLSLPSLALLGHFLKKKAGK